jgi:predicted RNase H-like HicB family nuclease
MLDGETIEETLTNGMVAMRDWTPAMRTEGHPIPSPDPLCGGVSRWLLV